MGDIELVREATVKSLFALSTCFLGYKDVTPSTHRPIIQALESSITRKIICVPRGSLKSSLGCVAYPIWLLLNNPNLRILIDSELFSNSATFLREIQGHLMNPELSAIFGEFKTKTWNTDEIVIKQRTKILKEPSITVGGVGTTRVGQHYDCLHPETLVLTSNGFVEAQALRSKMRVYTSHGKFESVTKVIQKQSSKAMIGIRSKYQAKTNWVTEDHKIMVFRDHKIQWVEASNIKTTDFMCIPINSGKTRQISKTNKTMNRLIGIPDVWRLIGYWLAEGCKTKNETNGIRLCFGAHEDDLHNDVYNIVTNILKVPCSISKSTKSNTKIIRFSHPEMRSILSKFGTTAKDKHFPPFALNEDFDKLKELIKGYWAGDGSFVKREGANIVSFASISHDLLSGLQLILARLGIQSSITVTAKAGKRFVAFNKKESDCKEKYSLSSSNSLLNQIVGLEAFIPIKPARSFFTDKFWMVPLNNIERKDYSGAVIDLEVKNAHDFYMPGMIAHNCIIGDDYNSPKNSKTPEMAQKVIDHYKYNLSILEPEGTYVIIGTRYSENDLIGYILREQLKVAGFPETKLYITEDN